MAYGNCPYGVGGAAAPGLMIAHPPPETVMTRITVRLAILAATAAILGACGSASITAPECDNSLKNAPACRQGDFINPHVDFINPHV